MEGNKLKENLICQKNFNSNLNSELKIKEENIDMQKYLLIIKFIFKF